MESLLLLGGVLLIVVIGSHDVAQFFLEDPDTRIFWLKRWLLATAILGVAIWGVLMLTGM